MIEVDQIFVIKVLLRLSWVNEFLTWHPEEWGNITWIKMLPGQVWTPDIVPYNDMDTDKSEHNDKYKKQVTVHSDGLSSWIVPVQVRDWSSVGGGQPLGRWEMASI